MQMETEESLLHLLCFAQAVKCFDMRSVPFLDGEGRHVRMYSSVCVSACLYLSQRLAEQRSWLGLAAPV